MNAATSPNAPALPDEPAHERDPHHRHAEGLAQHGVQQAKANLTAALVSFPEGAGNGTILTRGWMDPENRNSEYVSEPITPGTFYRMNFDIPGQGHRDPGRSPARR